jgi:hypothetical protein
MGYLVQSGMGSRRRHQRRNRDDTPISLDCERPRRRRRRWADEEDWEEVDADWGLDFDDDDWNRTADDPDELPRG